MSLEAFQLKGKNALVTGSRRGLGAAIAVTLAKAGANVGCHGHDANPGVCCDEISAAGLKTFYFSGDLADSEVCTSLMAKTIAEFGSIDILVNNAGAIRRAPAAEYPMEFWDELIAVSLTAVFRLSQLAGRHMQAANTPLQRCLMVLRCLSFNCTREIRVRNGTHVDFSMQSTKHRHLAFIRF